MDQVLEYIISELGKNGIKHDVHHFDSGAKMVDIWKSDKFYCIQLYGSNIGISEINEENPGFDTVPDKIFNDFGKFKSDLDKLLMNSD